MLDTNEVMESLLFPSTASDRNPAMHATMQSISERPAATDMTHYENILHIYNSHFV